MIKYSFLIFFIYEVDISVAAALKCIYDIGHGRLFPDNLSSNEDVKPGMADEWYGVWLNAPLVYYLD